jgi:hypothetical protein
VSQNNVPLIIKNGYSCLPGRQKIKPYFILSNLDKTMWVHNFEYDNANPTQIYLNMIKGSFGLVDHPTKEYQGSNY